MDRSQSDAMCEQILSGLGPVDILAYKGPIESYY